MKRWKKRTLALMLAAGTAWGLCACGEEPASLPPAEETPSSQTSEPLVVSDGGNSEIFVPQGEETLLPNGWDLADFTQAGFDKDGPGDLGLRVPLTGEEEARLAGLLQPENWQEAQPVERGISPCLTLLDQEGGRQLVTAEDPELGTLILLREEGSDERWLYAAPKEVAGQARSLAEAIRERGGTDSSAQAGNQSAQVLWPQLVPQSLGESALYKEALSCPSAILYQGQPVTSREAVDRFIQSADQGERGELWLYSFWELDGSLSCTRVHFRPDGRETWARADSWEGPLEEGEANPVVKISLTDYGYLTWQSDGSGEPFGWQVVNDRELFPDGEERLALKETYLDPLGTGMAEAFAFPQQLPGRPHWIFEDLYSRETGRSPFDDYGTDWPGKEMAELLARYFDGLTPETALQEIRKIPGYDTAKDLLHYEGGRGGGPFLLGVSRWQEEGDTLTIFYEQRSPVTGVPYEDGQWVLTVRLMEDGSFRYIANQPA